MKNLTHISLSLFCQTTMSLLQNVLKIKIQNSLPINVFKKELLNFFKTVYPICVLVVRILKQQPTSSFTAPIITAQEKPSFTR